MIKKVFKWFYLCMIEATKLKDFKDLKNLKDTMILIWITMEE